MRRIAFIGLGTMGLPMAHNLIKGGFEVAGYDTQSDAIARHVENGGIAAGSAAETVTGADLLITMVPNAEHVRAVFHEPGGVQKALSPSTLVVDMSTIHPSASDAMRSALAEDGIRMVDAPVGRTSLNAIKGTLLILAGGTGEDIARAQPAFDCMGDQTIDCGGPGTGIRMKIVNNFMSIANNVLTAETLTLAEKMGVEVGLAREVMAGTLAGQGHMNTSYPSKVLKGDLTPAFMIDLAHKDIGLALDVANDAKVPLSVGAVAREQYSLARSQGRGEQDWTAIYAMMRQIAGLEP
ncbi:MAG: sulfolactaldehyde 3-reductase [Pseudomonadota bacterium]